MKSFEYATPATLAEALAQLSQQPGETEILAGGTDLVTCLKQGLVQPTRLVSLRKIPELHGIAAGAGGIRIGAMTTLGEIADSGVIKEKFPAIITAIRGVGSPQLWSMGTIGGDLCQRPRCWYFRNGLGLTAMIGGTSLVRDGQNRYHAIFGTDGPALFVSPSSLGPALVALEASVSISGPAGATRTIKVSEFFRAPQSDNERETVLRPGEILTQIQVPDRGCKNATYEIRHRAGMDWPYVTASVALEWRDNTARDARVVLGHVAAVPWLAREAGRVLEAAKVNPDIARRCGEAATQGAQPLSQNAYKMAMVRTAVKRAVLAAVGQ